MRYPDNYAEGVRFAYVAGPMRGFRDYNFPAFFAAEQVLVSLGIAVFNPARNDVNNHHQDLDPLMAEDPSGHLAGLWLMDNPQDFDLRNALNEDLHFITLTADMLVVLDGWEDSKGARAEVHTAHALGIPVYTLDEVSGTPLMTAVGEHDPAVEGWTQAFEVREHPSAVQVVGEKVTPPRWPLLDRSPVFAEGGGEREFRTVSATGGQKGTKLARFDLIPVGPLTELAKHYGRGGRKYEDRQWEKGFEFSKSYAALCRHLTAWWGGEDLDEETGSPHLAAVAWHAFALLDFIDRFPQYDDREGTSRREVTSDDRDPEATTPPTE